MRRLSLVFLLLACAGEPAGEAQTESWPYAVARPDCAPWDGAATSVYLTSSPLDSGPAAPMPSLRLSVYRGLDAVRGQRWPVGESGPDGAAAVFCASEAACVSAASGWIQFESGPTAGPLRGRYEVLFPDGTRRAGMFRAPVQDVVMMCG